MDLTPKTAGTTALPTSVPGSAMEDVKGTPDKVKHWLREIRMARKREREWRKKADECVCLYEGDKNKQNSFNIFYSNTEILAPALYNVTPRPEVQRRYRDEDPIGKDASEVTKRILEYLADTNESDYPDFDTSMQQTVLAALVPGRGLLRFKHEVKFEEVPAEPTLGGEEATPSERVAYETICGEPWPWDRFTHGYAKTWRQVPWVDFDHYMSREELVANFGDIGKKIELTETDKQADNGPSDSEESRNNWREDTDTRKEATLALVHEIWDKNARMVYFISPGLPDELIKEVDDPLRLEGFFPMPEPLRLFAKLKTLTPTTLLQQYEEQAKELNRVSVRINRILEAIKARGAYDNRFSGIEKLLESEDNVLIPIENISQLGDTGNMEKIIWLQPIERLVAVLQQLYIARQEIKAVIYELTGISDVLRGASSASETLGAQKIKEQWGSLRLSRSQKTVQKFARDCFRMMAELAIRHLGMETIRKITGLPFPTNEQKQRAQGLLEQAAQIAQMAQVAGQQPPPPPPELAQAQEILASPSWEDIISLLQSELMRSYRIDIETNSTIDPEATDDKEQIVELMNAIGQFMNAMAPAIQSGQIPKNAVKNMLMIVTRRFRFGSQLEEELMKIGTEPPPPDPAAEAAKVKAEADAAKLKMEMEFLQQKQQLELQGMQAEFALKQAELALKQQELELKREELVLKAQADRQKLQSQVELNQVKAATQMAAAKAPPETKNAAV